MDVRLCPRCGAPLAASTGSIETCRFCGVQGMTRPSVDQAPPMPELAPDDDTTKLFDRYVAGARAFALGEGEVDERFMRAVEWLMEVPASRGADVRREIMNYVGALAIEGKKLTPGMNKRLDAALEKLLLVRRAE